MIFNKFVDRSLVYGVKYLIMETMDVQEENQIYDQVDDQDNTQDCEQQNEEQQDDGFITVTTKRNKVNRFVKREPHINVKTRTEQTNDDKMASQTRARWFAARNSVSDEYAEFLCSYSQKELQGMVEQRKHTINSRTGEPFNYIVVSCAAYDDKQRVVDYVEEDGFKFVMNQFFSSKYFVNKLKTYYGNLGFKVGFITKNATRDDKQFRRYTHLKLYFN